MQFSVTFVGGLWRDSMSGLAVVDLARQQLNVPALDAALIEDVRFHNASAVTAVLTEEQARRAGCFTDRKERRVDIAGWSGDQSLAAYVAPVADAQRDPGTDAVTGVTWHWEVDVEGIVAAWFAAGCPLKWPQAQAA